MKKITLTLLLVGLIICSKSQVVSIIENKNYVKEQIKVENQIIGKIDSNIYVATYISPSTNKYTGLRLTMYDKDNVNIVKTIGIDKFQKAKNKMLRKAVFVEAIIKNDKIYCVWVIHKNESKLIMQVFDKELKQIVEPTILYELEKKSLFAAKPRMFVKISEDGSKIVAGGEESTSRKENMKIQYKLLNSELEQINSVKIDLPFELDYRFSSKNLYYSTTLQYQLDNNGILYYHTKVYSGKVDENAIVFGKINPENSENNFQTISFKNKLFDDFKYEFIDNNISIYGTYSVIDEKKTIKKYGIFTSKLDKNTFEQIEEPIFNMLEPEKISYTECKASGRKLKEEIAIEKISENGLYITDKVVCNDGIILTLSSILYLSVCNNGGCQYSTNHYGTSFIKLNNEGKIHWISNTIQDVSYEEYIKLKYKLFKEGNELRTVIKSSKKENTSYLIDEKTGLISKYKFKSKFKKESNNICGNELFYIGTKNPFAKTGIIIGLSIAGLTTGIAYLVSGTASLVYYAIGGSLVGLGAAHIIRGTNVYFGKYEFK